MSASDYPPLLEDLIAALKTLPGVGRRGAERLALAMLKWPPEKLQSLSEMIGGLFAGIGRCSECGAIAPAGELCAVCGAPGRDRSVLCVVEEPQQIFAIEKSGIYRGLYHVLGGRLSPLDGKNGENLSTEALLARAGSGECREVILALSADVEGRATAIYLAELLRKTAVRVSQPALGLPAGSNLSYADAATIGAALTGRREL